jgi:hypothetical protein
MKKIAILSVIFICATALSVQGQIVNLTTADGRPFIQEVNNGIDGSPYFLEEYLPSKVVLNNESQSRDALGRVNLLRQTFEFKNNGDLLEIPFGEIKSIELINESKGEVMLFMTGGGLGLSKKMLYLEVFSGAKLKAVKELSFKLSDVQVDSYSQSEAKRKVMESEELFLILSGKPTAFKRNQKSFLSVLPSSFHSLFEQYSKTKKISWKNDAQLVEIFEYLENN